MLWVLLKLNLRSLLASTTSGKRRGGVNAPRSKLVMGLLLALLGLCGVIFGVMFFSLFYLLASSLAEDIAWLGFALMGIITFLIDFIMTIFTAKSQIFEAKDNDLLLSLPLRPRDILLSRMLLILLTDFLFEVIIVVPAYIAWVMARGFSFPGLVCTVLCALVMPLLALSCACLVGWLLSLVTSRLKNATLVNTILSVILFVGYMAFCMGLQNYSQLLLTHSEGIAAFIKKYLYPFYCLGDACANGNFLSALIYIAVMVIPFVITCIILAYTFLSILTTKRGSAHRVYREKEARIRPLTVAFVARELRRLFSSTTYLMNAGMGLIFFVAIGIAMFFLPENFSPVLAEMGLAGEGLLPAVGICGISVCAAMVMFTAPSVSLEGVTIYDIKALPIPGNVFLMAKAYMHLLITLPFSLLASVLAIIALPVTPVMGIFLVVTPVVLNALCAMTGLVLNTLLPRFDWESETIAVKQSASTMLTMLVNFIAVAAAEAVILGTAFLFRAVPIWVPVLVVTLVAALVTLGLYLYIHLRGDRIMENLG